MKKGIIFSISVFVIIVGIIILFSGSKRTDVYLKDFNIKNNIITLNVGVTDSAGYIRKLKIKNGGDNLYITFYRTYGINSKIGSKDKFQIEVNDNTTDIYFYSGDGGYKKVLQKDLVTGTWVSSIDAKNELVISESKKCDNTPKIYVDKDITIYTYCIDNIKIYKNYKYIELKDWMNGINQTIESSIDEILSYEYLWDDVLLYKDGGTKKYYNEKISIIKCNTLDGNKDVYIGNSRMEYKNDFCKDN